jgi:hypothetical protein
MVRARRRRALLIASAVFVTAVAVVWSGAGSASYASARGSTGTVLVTAAFLNSLFIYLLMRSPKEKPTRRQRVNAEFRHEVERFLSTEARGPRRPAPQAGERPSPPPPVDPEPKAPADPPEDLIARIGENLEILGGYREDLSALLRLYRTFADESISLEEKKRVLDEVKRFEKVIALAFLLEDSVSVQDETRGLLVELRRSLHAEEGDLPPREEWTPVDLREQIEQVIRSLPEERARAAFFQRHLADVPLVLSRPNSLFEALYHDLDCLLDAAGPGKAIHIRTAQRGDDIWIGMGLGPTASGEERLREDRRLRAAGEIWKDLGGCQSTGDGEVRVLLPMHGPASVFSERSGRTANEKTS